MDTSFLDTAYKKVPAKQRQWHIDNGVSSLKLCDTCNLNIVNWSAKDKTYRNFCSVGCAHRSPVVRLKTAQTCLDRFGSVSNLSTQENKEKVKQTCLLKYGVDNFSKTSEFKIQSKATFTEKYGVDNPSKLQHIKDKISDTHLLKYGRTRQSQLHIPSEIIAKKNDRQYMLHLYKDLQMPVTEIAEVLNVSASQLCLHFKNNLGIDITRHIVSRTEREIHSFVTSVYSGTVISSDRTILKPKELDLYFPELKLAFEIDGIAWHTELRGKDKNYHINKTLAAKEQGIHLVHILDSEWRNKRDIVKSRISSLLQKNTRIYARKCTIQEVSLSDASEFFNRCHIQHSTNCSVVYGLYYNGSLVSAMSFGKPRYSKTADWELIRFANDLNTNVIGAANKLFTHFKRNFQFNEIVSYCDARWNTGNVYRALGFTELTPSGPSPWYTKDYNHIAHRSGFQKHKLESILNTYNPEATAWDNLVANGFDRYWDCGNYVFTLRTNTASLTPGNSLCE